MRIIRVAIAMTMVVLSQDASSIGAVRAEGKSKVPQIDPRDAAVFWRAQVQVMELAPEWQRRSAALQAIRAKLDRGCGDRSEVADEGGLKCVERKLGAELPKVGVPPKR